MVKIKKILNCDVCYIITHHKLMNNNNNNCLEITKIHEKEYSLVYLVADNISNFKYIVKKGLDSIVNEYAAYQLLLNIKSNFITNCLPKVYKYFIDEKNNKPNVIIEEYINGYAGYELDKIKLLSETSNPKHRMYWIYLLMQIAYFINILEKNKIQHNDFHLGNIIVYYDDKEKCMQLKVIDLETLTDYQQKNVFSNMIKTSSKEEK